MQRAKDLTDGFLTPEQFAAGLGVSLATVQSWVRDRRLPAVRLGRVTLIPEDALRRILDRAEGVP